MNAVYLSSILCALFCSCSSFFDSAYHKRTRRVRQLDYVERQSSPPEDADRSPHFSLFSSLPFLPRPEFKPERYLRSRTKRSSGFTSFPFENINDPPQLLKKGGNTIDLFSKRPDPYRSDFVTVHLPLPDPRLGPNTGPTVIPILFGNLTTHADHFKFPSSVVLVLDEKGDERCNILVDTGLAMYKNTIIGGLAAHGLRPTDVNYLVLSHGDVDNVGNLNLFLDAEVFSANRKILRQSFYAQRAAPTFDLSTSQLPSRPLCDNTDIYLTPGFSPTDLTLLVRNVQNFGSIAVVGNLILNEEDSSDRSIWEQFAYEDEMKKLWQETRNEIFCLADYIVPGHGKMFKVHREMKRRARCVRHQ